MTNEQIEKAEQMGAKRWQSYGKDRLYINARTLGYSWDYYNSGNIHHAYLDGASISNSEMRRVLGSKTYIDVETGKVVKGYDEYNYGKKVDEFVKELSII